MKRIINISIISALAVVSLSCLDKESVSLPVNEAIVLDLSADLGIAQKEKVQEEENQVVGKENRIVALIGAKENAQGQNAGEKDLPKSELMPCQKCPVCHIQRHEAEQEAEPIGDHVGEVEAVPNVVQLPENKADHEEQQQEHGTDLVPNPDTPGEEKEKCQHNAANAAV